MIAWDTARCICALWSLFTSPVLDISTFITAFAVPFIEFRSVVMLVLKVARPKALLKVFEVSSQLTSWLN